MTTSELTPKPNPVVIIVPYLTLDSTYEFGGWWIGPVDAYTGSWSPTALRNATRQMLNRFVGVDGDRVDRPTIIANIAAGVGGLLPDPTTMSALTLAVGFATLVTNPTWPYRGFDPWKVVSADNVDVWFQPVDLQSKFISLRRGSRIVTEAGGYQFTDQRFKVPPPLELPSQRTATFDADIAAAVYRVVHSPDDTTNPSLARRLTQTIRWWTKSWVNSATTSDQDRMIYYKTAFDSFTRRSSAKEAGPILTRHFSQVDADSTIELLWSPEEPSFQRRYKGTTASYPAIEHWLFAFADERNAIVHGDTPGTLAYDQTGSAYYGPMIPTADRVLREAILVALAELADPELIHSARHRALSKLVRSYDPTVVTYGAEARPIDGVWIITVPAVPAATVFVKNLIGAELTIEAAIRERDPSAPDTFEVDIIPIIREIPDSKPSTGQEP